jgi:hypothetical protein
MEVDKSDGIVQELEFDERRKGHIRDSGKAELLKCVHLRNQVHVVMAQVQGAQGWAISTSQSSLRDPNISIESSATY